MLVELGQSIYTTGREKKKINNHSNRLTLIPSRDKRLVEASIVVKSGNVSARNSCTTSGVEIGDNGTMYKIFLKCIGKAVKARFVSYDRR